MNFTNLASFAAILFVSIEAANLPVCNLPANNPTGSDNPITTTGTPNPPSNSGTSTVDVNSNMTGTVQTSASTTTTDNAGVTPDSTIDEKISKIMSLNLIKFGDLNQDIVKDFLKAEEWGRIDYHFNDDPLSAETLKKVMSVPFTSLTISEKADRIMSLKPTPQKMGDLKAEMVADILTPEEWGKIDFVDNNELINASRIVEILSK